MSDLNLALQNTAFAREEMVASMEMKMRSLSSIKAVRRAAEQQSALKESLLESCKPVMETIKDRFGCLRRKGNKFVVCEPAEEEDLDQTVNFLRLFEEEITREDVVSGVKLEKWPMFKNWMDVHCHLGHYMV